jgi:hypothetical protein
MNTAVKSGRVVALKKPEDVAEVAWNAINEKNPRHRTPRLVRVTGGAITATVTGGLSDAGFYGQFARRIREKVGKHLYIKLETLAKNDDECVRFLDAGANGIEANPEVLDRKLFEIICPGKAKQFGYDEWIKSIIKSVDVFGEGHVTPDVVQGVEMAQPFGFKTVKDALTVTLNGFDYLMRNGVVPRMNPWFIEKGAYLSNNISPPLEYYIESTQGWNDLWRTYGLPDAAGDAPRGSGFTDCHSIYMDLGDSHYK